MTKEGRENVFRLIQTTEQGCPPKETWNKFTKDSKKAVFEAGQKLAENIVRMVPLWESGPRLPLPKKADHGFHLS